MLLYSLILIILIISERGRNIRIVLVIKFKGPNQDKIKLREKVKPNVKLIRDQIWSKELKNESET